MNLHYGKYRSAPGSAAPPFSLHIRRRCACPTGCRSARNREELVAFVGDVVALKDRERMAG